MYCVMTSEHKFVILPNVILGRFQRHTFFKQTVHHLPPDHYCCPRLADVQKSSCLVIAANIRSTLHCFPLAILLVNLRPARGAHMPPLERSDRHCTHSPSERVMLCVLCSNVGVTRMPYARPVDVCVYSAVDSPHETPHTTHR